MSKVAIIQSNFLPWKGYFDFISTLTTSYFMIRANTRKEIGAIEIKLKWLMATLGYPFLFK